MQLRFFIPVGMNDTDSEPQSAPADATSSRAVLAARSSPLPTPPPPVARPFGLLAWVLAAIGFAIGLAWERYRLPNAEDVKRFTSTENYDIWATLIALQPALWGALAPGLWRTWWRLFNLVASEAEEAATAPVGAADPTHRRVRCLRRAD
jgi:hypothetical protein